MCVKGAMLEASWKLRLRTCHLLIGRLDVIASQFLWTCAEAAAFHDMNRKVQIKNEDPRVRVRASKSVERYDGIRRIFKAVATRTTVSVGLALTEAMVLKARTGGGKVCLSTTGHQNMNS